MIEELMKRPYRMVFTPDPLEGGFTVSFPELPGCLTVGETIEAAAKNAEDAKREWFIAALEGGYPIPDPRSPSQSRWPWRCERKDQP